MMTLVWANLRHRKTRSLLCIIAVGIGIALLLVLTGLCRGMIGESAQRLRNTGANIIVQPRGASELIAFRGSSLPVRYVPELERIPGVSAACPVLTWTTTIEKVIYVIYGVDLKSYESVGGKLQIVSGRTWSREGEILIDTRLADANQYHVGDQIPLLGSNYTVAGIFKSGVGARVYIPIQTLQSSLHLEGMCSLFFVKIRGAGAGDAKTTAKEIETRLPALRALVLDQYEEMMLNEITGLHEFFGAITTTALVISFLVILLTMYTTIIERTREIGILRSLGATRGSVLRMVVAESVLLCSLGVAAGIAFTLLTRLWLAHAHPLLTMTMAPMGFLRAALLGVGGGVLGALYPGFRAARVDPVEALIYE
ncbi:MAG: ABC transporter permease [Candidatus Aureabacteria bacterium]|nr:ABC transporter permease [Candidatus Auribacterota bacterium]